MPFVILRIIRNPLATPCERTTAPILHAARHQQNMVVLFPPVAGKSMQNRGLREKNRVKRALPQSNFSSLRVNFHEPNRTAREMPLAPRHFTLPYIRVYTTIEATAHEVMHGR